MNHPNQTDLRAGEAAWTLLKLLSWTSDYFASRGIEHPRVDAEILLAWSLGLRRIDLYVQYDKPMTQQELVRFREIVKRRARREPVAYITGEQEFWSLGLKVSPAVLIPRPETECLVETALTVLSQDEAPGARKILELGTGSGAVILALASERPGDILFATDQSGEALAVARDNARMLGVDQRISFLWGDWFVPVDRAGDSFDLIISNPPYIRRSDISNLQPEIHRFEPNAALDGGPDGIECLRHIIDTAPNYLRPGGYVVLEIGHNQKALLAKVIDQTGCYGGVEFVKDYSGYDRVARMRKKFQKGVA